MSGRGEEEVARHGDRSIFLEGGSTHKGGGSLKQAEERGEEKTSTIRTTTKNTQGDEAINQDDLNTRFIQV